MGMCMPVRDYERPQFNLDEVRDRSEDGCDLGGFCHAGDLSIQFHRRAPPTPR